MVRTHILGIWSGKLIIKLTAELHCEHFSILLRYVTFDDVSPQLKVTGMK